MQIFKTYQHKSTVCIPRQRVIQAIKSRCWSSFKQIHLRQPWKLMAPKGSYSSDSALLVIIFRQTLASRLWKVESLWSGPAGLVAIEGNSSLWNKDLVEKNSSVHNYSNQLSAQKKQKTFILFQNSEICPSLTLIFKLFSYSIGKFWSSLYYIFHIFTFVQKSRWKNQSIMQ